MKYMNNKDFKDFSKVDQTRYTSIRPGSKLGDPHITDIRQLKYNPTGTIEYKLDHRSDWSPIPRKPRDVNPKKFPKLYAKKLPISKRKYQDLNDLLSVIAEQYHGFYKNLQV